MSESTKDAEGDVVPPVEPSEVLQEATSQVVLEEDGYSVDEFDEEFDAPPEDHHYQNEDPPDLPGAEEA
jgi:hypothetical protein